MADKLFTKVQLPNSDKIWFKYGIYPVKGTQNASTNAWTGTIDIPQLYDGLTIAYYLPYAGTSSAATLNLTLANGTTTTGAINVYETGTTRITTHYAAGSTIVLTYWSAGAISVSGTATTEARWLRCDYDSNSNTWRNVNVNDVARLSTGTNTGAINFIDGQNVTIGGSGGNIIINASETIELSQAEYDALGSAVYNDKNYYVYDAEEPVEPIEQTIIYGWHIDPEESDPAAAITYLEDAVGMTPAAMGSGAFNYGSWANAFFMPKPCMVKFDGSVDYYLDPNNYKKKTTGVSSDVDNLNYQGNAMMEWPTIWWKYEAGTADGEGYFYCSNKKVDNTYHCWCNYDIDNNINNHFYTAIYNGCIYDGKMRSISGLQLYDKVSTAYSSSATYTVGTQIFKDNKQYKCITAITTPEAWTESHWEQVAYCGNTTGQQEVDAATANNTTAKQEWCIDVLADRMLINGLLILMGKSLNSQAVFGNGIQGSAQSVKTNYITGAGDTSGQFYGSKTNNTTLIKTFGMENWWGLVWHRTMGLIGTSTGYAYKLTAGRVDGSTASNYNSTGSGYKTVTVTRPAAGYLVKCKYGEFGYLPSSTTSGSTTTYYSDYHYNSNYFALFGGNANNSVGNTGPSYLNLNNTFSNANWNIAAALSLKPLA